MKLIDRWEQDGNRGAGIPPNPMIPLKVTDPEDVKPKPDAPNEQGQAAGAFKVYTLIGSDGKPYQSIVPGKLGGYRRQKIYGRLDCPSALRAIANGQYVKYRVFFADEETAIAAGYRPCGACMREEYKRWKADQPKHK